ncbi:cytoplasmic protein [Pullulanibacillus sp. KACC 23026]|uniref:cytoplasmic protein n=1 Tax=Pullulanibacillus sp. KACC 23026 TaxID=3028315 RepID=UPI0023B19A18|nr:cytoplasmic protein [Pullulanibacillus sp. KACC 23026]WEG12942.1 cytoplasmic protein [Pullulanibacillus sp. KACC 23026]
MTDLNDISINGSGSSGGGTFDKVTIRGEGSITSDVVAQTFKSYGTSRVSGTLKADTCSIYGESQVTGSVNAADMKLTGTLTINEEAAVQKAKVRGTVETGKDFKGEDADVRGAITVRGDVEYETFLLKGSLEVDGMLNAGHIDIQLKYNQSKVQEIGGETILIRRKTSIPFVNNEGELSAEVIEGDLINLEYTRAPIVRGKRVTIGKGCEIGVVEYTESLNKSGNPIIKEEKKI